MGGVATRKNIFDNKLYKVRLRKYNACGIVLLPISLFFYIIKSMSLPNIIYYSELRTWNVFSSRFVFSFNSSRKKTKTANNENSNGVQLLATN